MLCPPTAKLTAVKQLGAEKERLHRAVAVLPEFVTQYALQQLPRVRPWKFGTDVVPARLLVTSKPRLGERSQLVEIDRFAGLRLHDRVDLLAPLVIRYSEHCGVEDLRV